MGMEKLDELGPLAPTDCVSYEIGRAIQGDDPWEYAPLIAFNGMVYGIPSEINWLKRLIYTTVKGEMGL